MGRSDGSRIGGMIVKAFALGALWGSAASILESMLFNHSLRVGIQHPLSLLELVLNYAVFVGAAWVALRFVVEGLVRLSSRGSRGEQRVGSATGKRRDAARLTEAIAGAILFVGALAGYFQKGLWGPLPLKSPATLGIAAAGIVAIFLLAWGLARLRLRWTRTVRVALAIWVIVGFAWYPLFGSYTGLFRNRGTKPHAERAQNILLIIIDTLRPDFLDCYGARWGASPASDRLAAGGSLFENHVGQSTWTLPSTTSILTGLYPSTHGAVATGLGVSPTAPTLAETLQRAGYRTAAFTENAYIRPQNGFGRGFDYFWTYWLPWVFDGTFLYRVRGRLGLPKIEFTNKHAYITIPDITRPDEVNWDARAATDAALRWLRKRADAPFFVYLHYMGPHSPYGPREYLLDGDPPTTRLADYPRPMGGAFPLGGPAAEATAQEVDDMKILYAADNRYVEHHIGRILAWLEETGKLSETLVVFTSDHGEEFLEHGSWNHGSSAFDEVLRVPFILYDEELVPAGVRIGALTRQIDVVPTVLDLLGLDCPKEVQGRSLRALLQGVQFDPQPAYVEVYPALPEGSDISALVEGRHKIVRVSLDDRSTILLYDLENDPSETNNLAEAAPALRDSLLGQMERWDQIARLHSPLDPKRLKYFRSLGYINQ